MNALKSVARTQRTRGLCMWAYSLVRYVILAISVAKIDFIVFMASLGVK